MSVKCVLFIKQTNKKQTFLFLLQGADWGDDGVLLFEPHSRPVACMAFSTTHPSHLLSLSYDGSLRCMDVQKATFLDVRQRLLLYFFQNVTVVVRQTRTNQMS